MFARYASVYGDFCPPKMHFLLKSFSPCPFVILFSAGQCHSVFLRSDGSAVPCGSNDSGQCDIPLLEEGMCYTQASAGADHSVLLQSDGSAVAWEGTLRDNATFQLWRKECSTRKFLQESPIHCFCKVMGVLLLADGTMRGNATFPCLQPVATCLIVAKTTFFKLVLPSKMMRRC